MKKSKIQKGMLFFIIALGVGYGVYEYYLSFSNEKISELKTSYAHKQDKIKELEVLSRRRAEMSRMIAEDNRQMESLNNIIVSKDEKNKFIAEVCKMKEAGKLKTDMLSFSYPIVSPDCETTRVSITTRGSLEQISEVVRFFKTMERKVFVKQFSLQATPENYSADMAIDLYSAKQ